MVKEEEAAEDAAEAERDAKRAAKSSASADGKDAGEEEEEEEEEEELVDDVSNRTVSPAEHQEGLQEYDQLLGPFDDFSDLIKQYGFATLFVAAYPIAPLMACANNYLQIRTDGWKLTQLSRRPWPSGGQDIGTWESILDTVSNMAVVSNSMLICFAGSFLDNQVGRPDFKFFHKALLFVVLEHGIFFLKFLFALIIDDVPFEIQMQMDRNEFLNSKLIFEEEDEEPDPPIEEDEDDALEGTDLMIYDEDITELYLDYPGYENSRLVADGKDSELPGQGVELIFLTEDADDADGV